MSPIAPQAPIAINVMREVMKDHPEIDARDEESPGGRARLLDYACARLNKPGMTTPWGRKARERIDKSDPTTGIRLNTDALCYLRQDGRFEIIDAISGVDGSATWDHHGVWDQGQNGYWAPALSVEEREKPGPVPRPNPLPLPDPAPEEKKQDEPVKAAGPAVTYDQQLALAGEVVAILEPKGSRYHKNPKAQGQVVGHLLWKVQFENYPIQHALDNANRRARGEEAD